MFYKLKLFGNCRKMKEEHNVTFNACTFINKHTTDTEFSVTNLFYLYLSD